MVYFTRTGMLVMQDIASLARREIAVTLPYPSDQLGSLTATPRPREYVRYLRRVNSRV